MRWFFLYFDPLLEAILVPPAALWSYNNRRGDGLKGADEFELEI